LLTCISKPTLACPTGSKAGRDAGNILKEEVSER